MNGTNGFGEWIRKQVFLYIGKTFESKSHAIQKNFYLNTLQTGKASVRRRKYDVRSLINQKWSNMAEPYHEASFFKIIPIDVREKW